MLAWAEQHNIAWYFIAPGKTHAADSASFFNCRVRDELLNETLDQARSCVTDWTDHYNLRPSALSTYGRQPHRQQAIGCATPTRSADRMLLHPRQTA